jgi:hypothetical protein
LSDLLHQNPKNKIAASQYRSICSFGFKVIFSRTSCQVSQHLYTSHAFKKLLTTSQRSIHGIARMSHGENSSMIDGKVLSFMKLCIFFDSVDDFTINNILIVIDHIHEIIKRECDKFNITFCYHGSGSLFFIE